ncbi:MAG: SDR family oxidoreductase [Candidatus Omnitrophota bacterium]
MARYLVTGGAGFIGSHIARKLVEESQEVLVLDNFSTGKRENLDGILDKITLIEGDIRDKELVRNSLRGIDFILHQAALRSVPKSVNDPITYNDVNVTGTLNLLLVAREAGVKRLVLASSSSVYGDAKKMPEREDQLPAPISPYAATKLAGEYYCGFCSAVYGLETVSLRYFNVFGPRQSLESEYAVVIPKFISCMLKDAAMPIYGDGKQSRDFTYIDNVVQANILASRAKLQCPQVFNVASGHAYSVLDLVANLNKIMKKNIKPDFLPLRSGDVRHTLADISKARRLLGFNPEIDFVEGLERTVKWFESQR